MVRPGKKEYSVSRIFCIGRNYADHAKELGNEVPDEPVVFMKPMSSIVRPGENIVIPAFAEEVHFETELVLYIGKECVSVPEKESMNYVSALAIGLDLTLRDIQSRLKKKGTSVGEGEGI